MNCWNRARAHPKPGRVPTALLAFALVVGIAGCGQEAERSPEPGASTSTPTEAPAGPQAAAGAPVTELPRDFPRYPGSQVDRIGGRGSTLSAVFRTNDAPGDVISHYLNVLPTEGWSVQESSVGGDRTVMGEKEGRFLTIMASAEGDATKIGVLLMDR